MPMDIDYINFQFGSHCLNILHHKKRCKKQDPANVVLLHCRPVFDQAIFLSKKIVCFIFEFNVLLRKPVVILFYFCSAEFKRQKVFE